jgi:glutathione peroxidase
MTTVYDYAPKDPAGAPKPLSDFSGQALLIVNVASRCGFTPQYEGLEALQRKYADRGFQVLGFPCNQFGAQEPGDANEIASFCRLTYDVTFPMFGKIEVNGPGADPLYVFLKDQKAGLLGVRAIKWNFTKFLTDRSGRVMARFAPSDTPRSLEGRIEAVLAR